MTLRTKTLLASGLILLALVAVLYFVAARLLLTGFAQVENREVTEHMQRTSRAVDNVLLRLDDAVVGWSQWDVSYQFIRSDDLKFRRKFIAESVSDEALAACKSDVIIYIRNNGEIVFGTGYDRRAGKSVPLPAGIHSHLLAGSRLLRHRDTQESQRGIVLLPRGPLLIVSRPVVTNAGKGPIYGSLIWGRFLDDPEIKELAALVQMPLTVNRLDDSNLPSDFREARAALAEKKSQSFVHAVDEQTIAGYIAVKEINGKPALIVRGDMPRDIYQQGQAGVRYLLVSLLAIGLIFGLLAIGALERWVLARLSRLSRRVKEISANRDVSARVVEDGHDELSQLSQSVNGLLAAVEHSHQEVEHAREEAERARDEAERAGEEAERANQAKSAFLSRMSHELRTPMNAILGFGQLLEMSTLDARQREGVEHILKGGRHLLALINEVLDLARIEADGLSISPEPVCVDEIVRESLDLVRPLAAQRQISLSINLNGNQEDYVRADRQRLKQILINLLSNAVKYNRDGGEVVVACETHGQRLRIKVRDNGAGIAPEKMQYLFVPFERLGAEQSQIQGTGLGLAISKRMVELMDGQIGVESTPGQGSTFWVALPLAERPELVISPHLVMGPEGSEGSEPGQELELATSSATRRVLLYIEDNLPNVSLVQHILGSRRDIRLLLAGEGRHGLELASQHHPHLILLDLHLPDIMGDEVLRRLQANPETRDIPVVVISADATARQIERLRAAGASDYLTKPFDVPQFLRVVEEVLEGSKVEGSEVEGSKA